MYHQVGRYLSLRRCLSASEGTAGPHGERFGRDPTQEHHRTGARLFTRSGQSAPTKQTRLTLSRQVLLGGGIVALIIIAAGAAWNFYGGLTPSPSALPQTASAPAVAAPPLLVVVLPFANLGGDPSQQYLADVPTEESTTGGRGERECRRSEARFVCLHTWRWLVGERFISSTAPISTMR